MLQKQKSFYFFSLFLFFSFFSLSLSNPETTSLLAFKSSADTFNSLSSWVASSDPSSGSWFEVACDPATRRGSRQSGRSAEGVGGDAGEGERRGHFQGGDGQRRHGGGEEGEGEEKWREGNRWVFEADWRAEAPQHRRPQSLPQFDELLLVYDFFPGGSLHSALHGNRGPGRTPLAWAARLKLAAGSAEGLAFLHGCSKSKLLHGNLTSSNILVDRIGNACLANIGLQQLLPAPFSSSAYRAPELMVSNDKTPRKVTQKCDVYSFGVVLLEILTGRMPAEEGETNLAAWVKTAVQKECNTWKMLDFELFGDRASEGEMWALLEVALLCLTPLPKDRPTIGVVHRMIDSIRNKGVREDGAKFILDELTSGSSSSSHSARTS
ncbi:hypothetical protein C1H46_003135 [Malus baccata]|uniref:Protein kinase domain-containing protein n=1 Tax=Malus baccata TaxID=106549 RepID=A0A540NJD2_MALBA|nr:hypothetical protein C1H46_003135 [Malus baccata]